MELREWRFDSMELREWSFGSMGLWQWKFDGMEYRNGGGIYVMYMQLWGWRFDDGSKGWKYERIWNGRGQWHGNGSIGMSLLEQMLEKLD